MTAIRCLHIWIYYDIDAHRDYARHLQVLVSVLKRRRSLDHVRFTCTPCEGFDLSDSDTGPFETLMWEGFSTLRGVKEVVFSDLVDIEVMCLATERRYQHEEPEYYQCVGGREMQRRLRGAMMRPKGEDVMADYRRHQVLGRVRFEQEHKTREIHDVRKFCLGGDEMMVVSIFSEANPVDLGEASSILDRAKVKEDSKSTSGQEKATECA